MKKIILAIVMSYLIVSCDNEITDMNIDTKNPTVVSAESLFANAEKNLADQLASSNVNANVLRLFTQYWTETTYTDESNYDLITRNIAQNHWTSLYRDVLKDLKESKEIIEKENPITNQLAIVKANKLAVIGILEVYCYQNLVDHFGDIPYNEALNSTNLNPKYDNDADVYVSILNKLNNIIASINTTEGSFGTSDLILQGDMDGWKRFANSLKVRIGINLSENPSTVALGKTAIETAYSGAITSNLENISFKYLSAQPNTNPLYVDLVTSGRNDFVPTTTIIDKMNDLSDPRREHYFDNNLGAGLYIGGVPGATNNFATKSHIGTKFLTPTFEHLLIDYSEICFILAEASEKGYSVGNNAEYYYNEGIKASMNYWGVNTSNINDYLANPQVAYTTASGTYKRKIGEQAWLAMYNRGIESWNFYRRLDFPVLLAPTSATINTVPVRYTYPINEQTLNPSSYNSASTAIGGDLMTTKIFWDKF